MSTHILTRQTFTTSRALEFCSEKELTAQTGHPKDEWPAYVLKELVDNALDACEEAGVLPEITVTVDGTGITVTDNGPGLPTATIQALLDFTVRVSSREAYVSPTRGAQGNALKTILPMPYVLSGSDGIVTITSQGHLHRIAFTVDPIRQAPVVDLETAPDLSGKAGTTITVHWPDSACSILEECREQFLQVADDYTWLNPHLTLTVSWFGDVTRTDRTTGTWAKWGPADPTSAHWYDRETFERLIAAYLANGQGERPVREFVAEFRGLKSTVKQKDVLATLDLTRAPLTALMNGRGLDHTRVGTLLDLLQAKTLPVKPKYLGVIGPDHLKARMMAQGLIPESFQYKKDLDTLDGIPRVIEVAFGTLADEDRRRRLVTAVNWSAALKDPFRQVGRWGAGLSTRLSELEVDADDPVIYVLHLACARARYTDRGKSAVVIV